EGEAGGFALHGSKRVRGTHRRLTGYLGDAEANLAAQLKNKTTPDEGGARRLAEQLALALQASLAVNHSAPAVADAFIASRLANGQGRNFGTLSSEVDVGAILAPLVAGLAEG